MGDALIEITIKGRRTWEKFSRIMKKRGYPIDLRKASFRNRPLVLSVGCCKDELVINKRKDFPLKDLKCKCGKRFIIKYV